MGMSGVAYAASRSFGRMRDTIPISHRQVALTREVLVAQICLICLGEVVIHIIKFMRCICSRRNVHLRQRALRKIGPLYPCTSSLILLLASDAIYISLEFL